VSAGVRSILVPLDGSALSHQAIVPAGDIARRVGGSLALAVVHPWGAREDARFTGTEADVRLRDEETRYLELVERRVKDTFRVPTSAVLLQGDPATALVDYAREQGVNLVVGGTHGRGAVARALRGGVALPLAHAIECPALLLKPERDTIAVPHPDGFSRILVPLDGTAAAEASLEPAIALAAERRVMLHLVHVASPFESNGHYLLERRREATRYLNAVADPLERRGLRVDCQVVTRSRPGSAIASLAARWDVDLVAITTRRRGEGERMLLGSVADTVVQLATVPVLVCHAAVVEQTAEVRPRGRAYGVMQRLPAGLRV
jgi:nucleotide-binding universal stress UspA family protein